MKLFYIDQYLYDLSKDINNNNYISSFKNKRCDEKVGINLVKKELELFDYLNISLQDIYAFYRKKICKTSPKNIKLILDREMDGFEVSYLYRNFECVNKSEFIYQYVNWYIFVNNYKNFCPRASYLHEITHSQLIKGVNMCDDINNEVMPMFIEFLYGKLNNNKQLLYKINKLGEYVDKYMLTSSEDFRTLLKVYISSTMKAINLYDLYINSSKNVKGDISRDIVDVFHFNKTLEELLDKYEISFDNYKPKIKKLIDLA